VPPTFVITPEIPEDVSWATGTVRAKSGLPVKVRRTAVRIVRGKRLDFMILDGGFRL